jgi:hypothetical protein
MSGELHTEPRVNCNKPDKGEEERGELANSDDSSLNGEIGVNGLDNRTGLGGAGGAMDKE